MTIILVANALFVWITNSRLETKLAEIRAAGEPVCLADIQYEAIPPDQNAATYLRRARDDLRAIDREVARALRADPDSDIRSPAVRKAIQSALAAYPDAIPLLEQAAECPKYSVAEPFGPTGTSDPNAAMAVVMSRAGDHRPAARLLGSYRCNALISEGKRDEAVRSGIALLKLTRHFDREPSMVAFLISVACRGHAFAPLNDALQSGPVSEEVRQELENELSKHNINEAFWKNLTTERPFGLGFFRTFPGGDNWFTQAIYNHSKLNYLKLIDWYIADAQAASSTGFQTAATPPEPVDVWGSLLRPALEATRAAATRIESELHAIRVLNALQRRDDPDKPPAADLSDLGLPKEATLDVFTGKPLIVKKMPGGWLIYSVGVNLTDDGGVIDGEIIDGKMDDGFGPPKTEPRP